MKRCGTNEIININAGFQSQKAGDMKIKFYKRWTATAHTHIRVNFNIGF